MTSSAHIIHAHILTSEISWNYDLNRWKIRVYSLIICTVWHTACHTMHYMVELLEAVAMQQVRGRCTCMSMSNNSPTL